MYPFMIGIWKGERGGVEDVTEADFSHNVTFEPHTRFQLIREARSKYNADVTLEIRRSHAIKKKKNSFRAKLRVNEHLLLQKLKSTLSEEDKLFYGYFEDYIEIGEIMGDLPTKGPQILKKRQHMQDDTEGGNEMRLPIGNDRYVTVNVFKGKLYIHIRESFFNQAGRMLPTSKGIALTPQQWFKLTEMKSTIDYAIVEMQPMDAKRPTLAERRHAPPLKFQAFDEAGCIPQHPDGTSNNTK
ncbi:Activated RNA polymerase II transcriptional coactivator p15 [Holothuria leucospilota]|uniref:Activated RNA polymerase II transcriptional coactivator p15 n=1 Tax=Holothuria leucospilota TaxID=206669 RepID=A0A9Q0YLR4_HOLLE|nr:Activated RNA polymerase II transcriptional coactivator p15 [Holothuria leucospilota]